MVVRGRKIRTEARALKKMNTKICGKLEVTGNISFFYSYETEKV
jgi:hypothetical protein